MTSRSHAAAAAAARCRAVTVLLTGGCGLLLGACTGTSTPTATATVTVTAPAATRAPGPATSAASTSASPRPSSATTLANPAPTGPTPTAAVSGFDTLPAGYTFAELKSLKQVNGQWAVTIDVLTMCITNVSKDPACAGNATESEWEIVNVNPKAYTVPLAPGVAVQLLASGQPDDYTSIPMAPRTWPAAPGNPQMIVTYTADTQSRVTSIKQWWHP